MYPSSEYICSSTPSATWIHIAINFCTSWNIHKFGWRFSIHVANFTNNFEGRISSWNMSELGVLWPCYFPIGWLGKSLNSCGCCTGLSSEPNCHHLYQISQSYLQKIITDRLIDCWCPLIEEGVGRGLWVSHHSSKPATYNSASTACGLKGEYIDKENPRVRAPSEAQKSHHPCCV